MPKSPWPTKKAMSQIYDLHLWGGKTFDFYSGDGSHRTEIVKPYLEVVTNFLNSHYNSLTVVDLGCGDFNVGKQLTSFTKKYIAIDIVENLIDRNKTLFKTDNLEFVSMDIAKDELPNGDCVILRQVLQHLSNAEIQEILKKLYAYKYVIVTEHIPSGIFNSNKDIISGQGIRIKKKSGVDLTELPFSFKAIQNKILNETHLNYNKGRIVTTLYTCF